VKTAKIFILAAVVMLGLGLAGNAAAVPIIAGETTIRLYDGPGSTNGGEFKADIQSNGIGTDFLTFCLERNEYFSYGELLRVDTISTSAVAGGVGGGVGTPPADPLDPRTAYLYYLFSTGALPGYDYLPETGPARVADANSLQNLIWYLEAEGIAAPATGSQGAAWLILANANAGTSLWGVQVLNLVHASNGSRSQDQLYYPVPEPGTLLLLGSGILGVALLSRKRG
jgi:hypothetical protein